MCFTTDPQCSADAGDGSEPPTLAFGTATRGDVG